MPSKSRKFSQSEIEAWSLEGVKEWLTSVKLEPCVDEFFENNVDGYTLLSLTFDDIKEMVHNDKQRKTMKKALSSLPGNSISKKESSKGGKKSKLGGGGKQKPKTRGPLPAEPVPTQSYPPQHPPSPGLPRAPPPPVPSGSSRPTFQRLGPPIPTSSRPMEYDDGQEMYEDPAESYGDPGPDGPGDIYDCVDEMAEFDGLDEASNYIAPAPTFAPPPPNAPPEQQDYNDDDDQPIYDDGMDGEEDDEFIDDSFSDSSESEDYQSPYEDDQVPNMQSDHLQTGGGRSRATSDAHIRAVMGKFYAHGVLKDQAEIFATRGASTSSAGTGSLVSPPPAFPDDQDDIIEEDIYDTVPDEVKDMMAAGQLEDGMIEDDDIYDIPPEEFQMLNKPAMKPPIVSMSSPTAPPPPPESPPPPDDEIEEDLYDIPQEVIEESNRSLPNTHIYRPAAPPPPSDDMEQPPPGRPPKPMGYPSPSLPSRQQQFNRPPMRSPIKTESKPPPPAFPPTDDFSVPARPPKPEPAKAPPPPPLPESEPEQPKTNGQVFNRPKLRAPISSGRGSEGAPPPRPSSNTKPPLNKSEPNRAPSPNMEQGRNSDTTMMDRLGRLSTPNTLQTPRSSSPHQSPLPSPNSLRKTGSSFRTEVEDLPPMSAPPPPPGPAMKHHNMRSKEGGVANKTQTPPTVRKFGGSPGPLRKSNDVINNEQSEQNKTNSPPKIELPSSKVSKAGKPPIATKNNSKISEMMKRFEKDKKDSQTSESQTVSPIHTLQPSEKPPADKSPMSGRRIDRKDNVDDLMRKFGGKAPVSPTLSDRSSPSPESKPFLPPKPSGTNTPPTHRSTSPNLPPWKQKKLDVPAKESPQAPPSLPSKDVQQSASPRPPKPSKQWPPPQEAEDNKKKASPLTRRKFEAGPKVEESLPPRRESPSFRRKLPSDSSEENTEQEKSPGAPKQFVYKSYKPPSKPKNEPPPPAVPSLPPRLPEPSEPPAPKLPDRPRPGQSSNVPGPSVGLPRLPDRAPPSHPPPSRGSGVTSPEIGGAPKLPGRNLPQLRPPLPPSNEPSEPALPSRPQQTSDMAPQLPSRPPPKEAPAPNANRSPPPARPPKSTVYGSPVGQSWYHGNFDRKRSEAKLKRYAKDGTYIVRDSTKIAGEYSLSLWHSGGVRHLRIRLKGDKKFVLGEEKADELAFDTVIALVDYHKREPLHLRSGGDTVLMYECPH